MSEKEGKTELKRKRLFHRLRKAGKTVKRDVVQTKARVKELSPDAEENPSQYAEGQLTQTAKHAASNTGRVMRKSAGRIVRKGKEKRQQKQVETAGKGSSVETPKEPSAGRASNQAYRRENTSDPLAGNSDSKISTGNSRGVGRGKTAANATNGAIPNRAGPTERGRKMAAEKAAGKAKRKAEISRSTAAKTEKAAKQTAKAAKKTVKVLIDGSRKLVAALVAGGGTAALVVIVICLVGLLAASCFGIFFSGETTGENGLTLRVVVQEINEDFQGRIDTIKNGDAFDSVEMIGSRGAWPEVLSVYAVKTTSDSDNPMEVATMTEEKRQLLTDIFWQMNSISYSVTTRQEPVIEELEDENGELVEVTTYITKKDLHITISNKTAVDMAEILDFATEQRQQLQELLDADNSIWMAVLYGITGSDDSIVQVALSQIGNIGGEPYWSWYGFPYRVEWCACFVSWCAEQCGYIEDGIIPKYAGCMQGSNWFKNRNQWLDGSAEPSPGMIVFFDWDTASNPQNRLPDHTGIVEKVENGYVYTIEGNWGDKCVERSFPVGHYEIYGYGIPAYN